MSEHLQQIRANTKLILSLKVQKFESAPQELLAVLSHVFQFCESVMTADFSFLPNDHQNNARRASERLTKEMTALSNNNRIENSSLSDFHSAWHQFYTQFSTPLCLSLFNQSGASQILTEIKNKAAEINSAGEESYNQVKALVGETKSMHALAKQATVDAVTASHAKEFQDESKSSAVAAWIWLAVTVLVGAAALAVTYFFFIHQPQSASVVTDAAGGTNSHTLTNSLSLASPSPDQVTFHSLQTLIARIVFVSFAYFFVIWCGRNYSACRHNEIVNRHRRNAMQTFKAFVAASGDPVTREFMLRQAAACAFAPQQSGYLKDEVLPDSPPLLVDAAKLGGKNGN